MSKEERLEALTKNFETYAKKLEEIRKNVDLLYSLSCIIRFLFFDCSICFGTCAKYRYDYVTIM